jgi:putative hydrolase
MSDVPPRRDDDDRDDQRDDERDKRSDDERTDDQTGQIGSSSGIGFGGPGPGRREPGGGGEPQDPFAAMFEQLMSGGGLDPNQLAAAGIPADPAMLGQMLSQMQAMFAGGGSGPVNWDLARDLARQTTAQQGDPSISGSAARAATDALHLAETWLDAVTDMPASSAAPRAWARAEWVENTLPTWRGLVEPVASSVADAMAEAMTQQVPEQMKPMMASAGSMMRQVGGAVFGMQVGQAIGALATEVLSGNDIGLPLSSGGTALIPTNIAAFSEGLGVPDEEVRLYLALREAAHARLFAHVPWLRSHLLGAVESYARGITIDTDAIERAVRDIDPMDPSALQNALGGGLFEPQRTAAQQAALDRLETALALVEGWVDEVVDEAARHQLPHAGALRETMRRRRAAGGPAEHTLASLVGLELRPRRLRDAAMLWQELEKARGKDGRDAVWAHPDLLPTAEDLDHPGSFVTRRADAEAASAQVDAALEELLRGGGKNDSDDKGDAADDHRGEGDHERGDGDADEQR